jgi:hypothetical protein
VNNSQTIGLTWVYVTGSVVVVDNKEIPPPNATFTDPVDVVLTAIRMVPNLPLGDQFATVNV